MRTTGRRTLAGIAAGALAFAGLAFVATPSAQAAPTVRVICEQGGTPASPATDPTSIDPNCTVPAGVGLFVNFIDSGFAATPPDWLEFTVEGASTFSFLTPSTPPAGAVISPDGKKASGAYGDMTNVSGLVRLSVFSAGARTITVRGGASQAEQDLRDLGTLTVTGTGLGNTVAVSQAYEVVNAAGTADAPVAIVHVLDSAGAPLNLANATVGPITQPVNAGTIKASTTSGSDTLYNADDCVPSGTGKGTLNPTNSVDPQATGAGGIVTPACEVTLAAGANANNLGLWVFWDGATTNVGKYSASFNLTLGSSTYPVKVDYTIANNLAAATTGVKFDKDQYRTGERVTVSTSFADPNGLPVPDGLGSGRGVSLAGTASNAPIYSPLTGLAIPAASAFKDDSLATYGGVATGAFLAPPTPMENFRYTLTLSAQAGFAASIAGTSSSATARIGDPAPVTQSIAIVGSRVEGTTQVIVEGTSEGLVGKTVTPYFRFPGETGFTAGTGTRTVDAEGNFNWQRKTGKKIAVQFRGEGVVSNTVIIDAK